MAGTTAAAQVEKREYKNQTAGWLGVVKVDHLGGQVGYSIKPHGTVWLSDDEAILTSRAPADPKDNPFEEQMFLFEDGKGGRVEQPMRPLILLDSGEDGEEAQERYVPVAGLINAASVAAEAGRTDDALAGEDRMVPTDPQEPTQVAGQPVFAVDPAHASPAATAVAPVEEPEEEGESWTENPDRTEEPQRGSLGGADGDAPGPVQGDAEKVAGQASPPQAPVQQTVGAQQGNGGQTVPSESAGTGEAAGAPSEQGGEGAETVNPSGAPTLSNGVAEELAAETATGEETGAADTPTGAPAEGEFATHEEVGSPDAPNAAAESENGS